MRSRHPEQIVQGWAAVDPFEGDGRMEDARQAIERAATCSASTSIRSWGTSRSTTGGCGRCSGVIDSLNAPVMIDVGTTGMGAGMAGGHGAIIRHAHPSAIDELAADFPNLTIVAAHPGLAVGGRDDGGRAAQGQRVLGAVGLGAEVLSRQS